MDENDRPTRLRVTRQFQIELKIQKIKKRHTKIKAQQMEITKDIKCCIRLKSLQMIMGRTESVHHVKAYSSYRRKMSHHFPWMRSNNHSNFL